MGYAALLEDTASMYVKHPVLPVLFSFLILFTAVNTVVSAMLPLLMVRILEIILLIFATGVVFQMAPVMETGVKADVWDAWHRFEEQESRVLLGELLRTTLAVLPFFLVSVFIGAAVLLPVIGAMFNTPVTGMQTILFTVGGVTFLVSLLVYVLFSFTLPEIVIREQPVIDGLKGSAQFVIQHPAAVTGFFLVELFLFTVTGVIFAVTAAVTASLAPGITPLLGAVFAVFALPFFTVFKAFFYIRVRRHTPVT